MDESKKGFLKKSCLSVALIVYAVVAISLIFYFDSSIRRDAPGTSISCFSGNKPVYQARTVGLVEFSGVSGLWKFTDAESELEISTNADCVVVYDASV